MRRKKMQKYEPKMHLTRPYKNYAKKKKCTNSSQKAPNNTLQKLCQEKKIAQILGKKAANINYAKKKNAQIRV